MVSFEFKLGKKSNGKIKMSKKVNVVIVTFNRINELKRCIDMILIQSFEINKIFIVDNNSSDGTSDFISKLSQSNSKFINLSLKNNIGGAGGFSFGLQKAFENSSDFYWLMDDDGYPLNKLTLEILMESTSSIYSSNKLILSNSLVTCGNGKLSFNLGNNLKEINEVENYSKNDIFWGGINPFNGTLISNELVQKIGFPNKNFFIKGDETDFLYRAINSGASVFTVNKSLFFHPYTPITLKKFLGKSLQISLEKPWKEYYKTRNYVYMYLRNRKFKKFILFVFYRFFETFFHKNQYFLNLAYFFNGVFDGIFGILGPRKKPS